MHTTLWSIACACLALHVHGSPAPTALPGQHLPRDNGFVEIGGHTYYISDEIVMTWLQAAQYCNILNMTLLSLENQRKSDDFRTYMIENNNVWQLHYWTSGLKVLDQWVWTGLGQVVTHINMSHVSDVWQLHYWTSGLKVVDQWVWTGLGQVVKHTDWFWSQPDEASPQLCIALHGAWNQWDDKTCDLLRYFICQ